MLHIYYGRENTDKAEFIYNKAKPDALILVPDQFTLEAEKEAIRILGRDGIMDMEVLSISRLGLRMLRETGGLKKKRIDIYGRHILLTSIINGLAEKGELSAYGTLSGRPAFVKLMNDFISGIKQHGATPEDLEKACSEMQEREILCRKLSDIKKIFEEYEARIEGRFTDTEDYIDAYIPAASESGYVRGRDIWIYGFDTFSPKNTELISELMKVSDISVVMTSAYNGRDRDLFAVTRNVIDDLTGRAADNGIPFEKEEIKGDTDTECLTPSGVLERELFSIPYREVTPGSEAEKYITILEASNYYSEAEAAASYVRSLVRDEGLRYRDILIVCNDLAGRGDIIRRVFEKYDMTVFTDEKQGILGEPLVILIIALTDIIAGNYRTKDVISILKTGMLGIERERADELENYALKYRIRGNAWTKPFLYGKHEYDEEELLKIEETRKELADIILPFAESFRKSRNAEDRVRAVYDVLTGNGISEKIIDAGKSDVWDAAMNIFDQIVNISGSETVSAKTLSELFLSGFSAVEIGAIPPTPDGLVLGTMQRTRTGRVKALVVLGAEDGSLPLEDTQEEILSEDEKEIMSAEGFDICRLDKVRAREEKLAVYRTFARPGKYVYISCAASSSDGKEKKQSVILSRIKKIFPGVKVIPDPERRGEPLALMESRESALGNLISVIRDGRLSEEGGREWRSLLKWYRENDAEALKKASAGIFYSNRKKKLDSDVLASLYGAGTDAPVKVSPSRLEKFSRCPFAHFISYGLRPEERRVFEAGMREIGDIYHESLMKFSKRLSQREDNGKVMWEEVTREDTDRIIDEIIEEEAETYRDGLFTSGGEENYRKKRIGNTLKEAAWALIEHVRAGSIKEMYFEEGFGNSGYGAFPAVEIDTSEGKVSVEGKIDRVDILGNGSVKIIDYKSGHEKWNTEEALKGWRLQLMLYLKGASREKGADIIRKPAGIFYFIIKDVDIDAGDAEKDEIKKELKERIKKEFRMNGLVVAAPGNVEEIDADMEKRSSVVDGLRRCSKTEDGDGADELPYAGAVIGEEDFKALMEGFDDMIEKLAEALLSGDVEARPKRIKENTACMYCRYRSICRFDVSFKGCDYEKIM